MFKILLTANSTVLLQQSGCWITSHTSNAYLHYRVIFFH